MDGQRKEIQIKYIRDMNAVQLLEKDRSIELIVSMGLDENGRIATVLIGDVVVLMQVY